MMLLIRRRSWDGDPGVHPIRPPASILRGTYLYVATVCAAVREPTPDNLNKLYLKSIATDPIPAPALLLARAGIIGNLS